MLIVFLTYSESRLSYIISLCNTTVFPLFCFQVPFHPLFFSDQENRIYKQKCRSDRENKLDNWETRFVLIALFNPAILAY